MKFTPTLMNASALLMGALGLLATFAPDTLLRVIGASGPAALTLLVQVTGALYVGFAAMNWMGRNNLIGGIYSRPLVVANLMHFLTAGLAMLKHVATQPVAWYVMVIAIAYAAFAVAFGVVLGRHPIRPA